MRAQSAKTVGVVAARTPNEAIPSRIHNTPHRQHRVFTARVFTARAPQNKEKNINNRLPAKIATLQDPATATPRRAAPDHRQGTPRYSPSKRKRIETPSNTVPRGNNVVSVHLPSVGPVPSIVPKSTSFFPFSLNVKLLSTPPPSPPLAAPPIPSPQLVISHQKGRKSKTRKDQDRKSKCKKKTKKNNCSYTAT
jgi:hypothetical protein